MNLIFFSNFSQCVLEIILRLSFFFKATMIFEVSNVLFVCLELTMIELIAPMLESVRWCSGTYTIVVMVNTLKAN